MLRDKQQLVRLFPYVCAVIWLILVTGLISYRLILPLGRYAPQTSPLQDYMLALSFCVLSCGVILFLKGIGQDRPLFMACWLIKCILVTVVMLYYEYHYKLLDAFRFFDATPIIDKPRFGNGTYNMKVFSSVLSYLGIPYFRTQMVVFSWFGFLGIYFFYLSLRTYSSSIARYFILGACLYPSMLFWSSIFGKDPLILFFLGLTFLNWSLLYKKAKTRNNPIWILLTLFSLIPASALLLIRPWMFSIYSLSVTIFVFVYISCKIFDGKFALPIFGVTVLTALLGALQFPSLWMGRIDKLIKHSQDWSRGGSAQLITQNLQDPVELIDFALLAQFTSLFRPIGNEFPGMFSFVVGVENILVLSLFVFAIIAISIARRSHRGLPAFHFGYLLTWSAVYGFVSYQNLGSAARFRLQACCSLLIIICFGIYRLKQELERQKEKP